MTTRHHPADFNRTASGFYLRQAEAALSAQGQPADAAAVAVTRTQRDGCTIYYVAPAAWKRQREEPTR